MTARRDPLHQPPNPADLSRVPPDGPICARIRGLLRDYVDGDLTEDQGSAVEEHAHVCRVCAVELARAEHEVLRLRRAFLPQRATEPELSPRFAQRVVDQLVATDATMAPGGGDQHGDQHGDGARGHGGRKRERDSSIGSPAGMLVAGLFFLFLLGVGVRVFADEGAMPTSIARLVVLRADRTFDGRSQPLGAGDSVGELQSLWVRRGGAATVDWHDPSARTQPAATIQMEGGEIKLQDGAPMLVDGKVLIETNRAVDIPIADGSRVGLGVGEYVIAAEIPVDMLTGENALDPDDPLALLAADLLLVEVEVLSGEPARILRTGSAPTLVAAGGVGVYQGGGLVSVSSGGPVAGSGGGEQRTEVPSQGPALSVLSGHVLGPGGLPGVGADVFLWYASEDVVRNGGRTTGADGSFRLETDHPCDSSFAIVVATPNALRHDLGLIAPHAVRVQRQGDMAQLDSPLGLESSAPLLGVVRDELGQALVGLQVVPMVVDELFGTVLSLVNQRVFTDAMGMFGMERLPARLPAHQTLVLLLSHNLVETTIVPVPQRGSLVAATAEYSSLVARRERSIQLRDLPANTQVTIYEQVPGLPPGVAAVVRTVTSNPFGFVPTMKVGRGALWLRRGPPSAPMIDRLELEGTFAGIPRYRPAGDLMPLLDHFRGLQPLGDSRVSVASSFRHRHFALSEVANAVSSQALLVVDGANWPVEAAEVFAVAATGPRQSADVRFLGFTLPNGAMSLGSLQPDEGVFVIGPDGSVGWVHQPTAMGMTVSLPLHRTGRVLLGPGLRPLPSEPDRVVTIRFRRLAAQTLPGMKPEAMRFANAANAWEVRDLPAGTYHAEIDGVVRQVEVPSMGWVELN